MIADIVRIDGDWVNLYTEAAIPVGTGCIVYNKLPGSLVLLWEGSTPPAGYDGAQLEFPDCLRVTAGGLGLWCRAGPQWPGCTPRFRVSVQVAT